MRARARGEQVYAPRFFFILLIPAVLSISFHESVFLLVEKTAREEVL